MTILDQDKVYPESGVIMRREIIIRLGRLLNMRYKPSEIADEIGVSPDTVQRSYLKAGCPFEKDAQGQVWIIGTSFRSWALRVSRKGRYSPGRALAEGEAFCMRCNRPTRIIDPKVKEVTRYLELIQGKCLYCGGNVNRGKAKRR